MSDRQTTRDHRYGEDSPFVRLLGTPGRVQILDVFLRKFDTELSPSDISHLVSESTFSRHKDLLLELGIIQRVRKDGGKNYYKVNLGSDLVKDLGQFHSDLFTHSKTINEETEAFETSYVGRVLATKASTTAEELPSRGRGVEKSDRPSQLVDELTAGRAARTDD